MIVNRLARFKEDAYKIQTLHVREKKIRTVQEVVNRQIG